MLKINSIILSLFTFAFLLFTAPAVYAAISVSGVSNLAPCPASVSINWSWSGGTNYTKLTLYNDTLVRSQDFTPSGTQTTFTSTGLPPGDQYRLQVFDASGFGLSPIITPTCAGAPPPGGGGGGTSTINIPTLKYGYTDIGKFIGNILTILFAFSALVVLFMIVWGAYEWITSGGDKEAVSRARGRIIGALIGLAILAVSFALAVVAGKFLGFENISNITIPPPK